jgi:Bacterial DNA topoisomerase IB, N-terminal domain
MTVGAGLVPLQAAATAAGSNDPDAVENRPETEAVAFGLCLGETTGWRRSMQRRVEAATDEAQTAGLIYVSADEPGLRRVRRGRGFAYLLPDGSPLTSARERERLRRLAIPPAWTDVWIWPFSGASMRRTRPLPECRERHLRSRTPGPGTPLCHKRARFATEGPVVAPGRWVR